MILSSFSNSLTVNYQDKKSRQLSDDEVETIHNPKKIKISRIHFFDLPNELLRSIFDEYLGWGNKACYNASLVSKKMHQIVETNYFHFLINTILKFKNEDSFDPDIHRIQTFPQFGNNTVSNLKKMSKILSKHDDECRGFRRLLLQNLNLDNLPRLKKTIQFLMSCKPWFPPPTSTKAVDCEIKRIAINATKIIDLFQTDPTLWSKPLINDIDWKNLPLEASKYSLHPDYAITSICHLILDKIPQIKHNFENRDFVCALFYCARFCFDKTNSMQHLIRDIDNNDEEYLLEIVAVNGFALSLLPHIKNNKKLVLAAVVSSRAAFNFAGPDLKKDKDFVLEVVGNKGLVLEYASQEMKTDRDIVLKAVKQNGLALEFAAPALQNDLEIVLEAVKQNGLALEHASLNIKHNRKVLLEAIKQNGLAIQYAGYKDKNTKRIALMSVKQNGLALKHLSKKMKNENTVVLNAVKQNGMALKYASNRIRGFRNQEMGIKRIVLEGIKQNGLAIKHTSFELRNNQDFVREAVAQNGIALSQTYYENRNRLKLVMIAVSQCGRALEFVAPRFKHNKKVVKVAVLKDGFALGYAANYLQQDEELIAIAHKNIAFH